MAVLQDPVFEGVLLVDKPIGITSHDIVDRLRRKLKMKKIGHAGTLDPLATGLMIMLIGKATKVSQFLQIETLFQIVFHQAFINSLLKM